MEQKEKFTSRENKRQFFDKRLIKEIVKSVEEGLPRREAMAIHGMTKGTLGEWMNKYGSSAYQASRRRVYKPSEKRSVLRAIESGMSIKEAQVSFDISHPAIVRAWVREAKQENADLSPSNTTTEAMGKQTNDKESDEVKALKKALEEAELKVKALDTMIDIAEEQLKIDIRKKSGARQSQK